MILWLSSNLQMMVLMFLVSLSSTKSCAVPIDSEHSYDESLKRDFHILLWHGQAPFWGGGEAHRFNFYRILLQHNYQATILVSQGSKLEEMLKKESLPYKTYDPSSIKSEQAAVRLMCKKYKKNIVVCLSPYQLKFARQIADRTGAFVIGEKHTQGVISPLLLRYPNGYVGVSLQITEELRTLAQQVHAPQLKEIVFIPPFMNDDSFLDFSPQRTREAFFKKVFNLSIYHPTVICMVARFNHVKNHVLLIKSVEKIVYTYKRSVHVVLAGTGPEMKRCQKLIQKCALQDYVHMLEEVPAHLIPELLYHSNFHVLSSYSEAFAIASLEACLMKKPIIGATGTGAEDLIQDGKSGYLFKNNDVDDLAQKMMLLIDSKKLQDSMGIQAFDFVINNFSNEAKFLSTINFYQNIIK